MATYTNFEELPCWQRCRDVKLWTIEVVKEFPAYEIYELTFSVRKCARSSTRNLAEGFGRFTVPDKVNFCRLAKGSLYELTDDLLTAVDEGYLSATDYAFGHGLIENALRSINGYINYLNSRRGGDWNPSGKSPEP